MRESLFAQRMFSKFYYLAMDTPKISTLTMALEYAEEKGWL